MRPQKSMIHSLSTASAAGDAVVDVADKAITYLLCHPYQLPHLVPQFTPAAASFLLLKSQSDQILTLKFLRWARPHPFFDPCCKCCSLHILTNFKLYKSAQAIAVDLAGELAGKDASGRMVFDYLRESYQMFNSSSAVFDLMVKSYASLKMVDKGLNTIRWAKDHGFMPGVLSYNSVLDAIIRSNGPLNLALELLSEMREIGVSPNVFTYNILMRGFCGAGELGKGLGFFNEMERNGCLPNVVSYNTLMDAYFKAGKTNDAMELFNAMRNRSMEPNLITYNVIINGLCREGRMKDASDLVQEMYLKGLKPDEVTFNTLVNGYCKVGNFHQALILHGEMVKNGLSPNVITYTSLINSMCKSGNLNRAMEFLDQMRIRGLHANERTYTTLIDGFSQQGLLNEAYRLLNEMVSSGFAPSLVTYNALINGHCVMGRMEEAMGIIQDIMDKGLFPDVVTYSTLISAFCKNQDLDRAFWMKQQMVNWGILPDAVTYSSLIKGLCEQNRLREGCGLFEEMLRVGLSPDEVTYTTLINAYCAEGNIEEAFHLHDEMMQKGILPDTVTYNVLINGLNKQARTKEAKRLLLKLFYEDSVPSSITYDKLIESCSHIEFKSGVALLKGFCMKGLMNEADRVFESMLQTNHKPTEAVYNILIHGHSKCGNLHKAYKLYKEMVHSGFIPHTVMVIALIKALFREEMNKELGEVLEDVLRSCKLTDAELAKALVEVNNKEGNMDAVFNVLTEMAKDGLLPNSGVQGVQSSTALRYTVVTSSLQHEFSHFHCYPTYRLQLLAATPLLWPGDSQIHLHVSASPFTSFIFRDNHKNSLEA
ncbi:hypothetical protein Cgig2_026800 [Carnegiea gigantea]|uniref:Pentatricopeptide repeat-containing protein n=1 Tax=Carnegiea gigantea TaxID=171969 RepID=A0A9Q1JEM3_9CARY|nr:hypothetical protein Cgig2_026800 [Carnegiea gigantea]